MNCSFFRENINIQSLLLFLVASCSVFFLYSLLFVKHHNNQKSGWIFAKGILAILLLSILNGFIQKHIEFFNLSLGICSGFFIGTVLFPSKNFYKKILYNLILNWQPNINKIFEDEASNEIKTLGD